MREWQSLSHVKWECKYHVVIVPKYCRKVIFGRTRQQIGQILRQLCRQKRVELVKGNATGDLYSPSIERSSKVQHCHVNRVSERRNQPFRYIGSKKVQSEALLKKHFWSQGCCVSTVDLDEKKDPKLP